jgi:hypothetical protein
MCENTCCPERSVQPTRKKTPRVALTNATPSSPSIRTEEVLREQKNQNTSLEKNNNRLTKIPELSQQPNHNDCFIEAHNKILDEQQAANKSINQFRKGRTTMVNQLNRMIKIETVHENNNNDIGYTITENNNNEIIITEKLQVKHERSNTETEDMKHHVPETHRVV